MAAVTFDSVSITYPGADRPTVNNLNLDIADGEFLVLVGPSGCGKSTTLRALAGLEPTSAGTIRIGDKDVTGLEPGERDIAMVFQNYALYPHMTVAKNIGFPLRMAKVDKAETERRVAEAAEILGLTDYLDRKPKDLSGGQRQRVAMGRAIVRHPQVFLMDEPLSNLDAKLRVQTRSELAALQHRLGTTTVYVTHDQVEAMTMGDRVAVLNEGVLQQVAAPKELYNKPVNTFVAGFIGSPAMNLFNQGDDILGVRPEAMRVVPSPDSAPAGWATIPATVDIIEELGNEAYVYASAGDAEGAGGGAEGASERRLVARNLEASVPQRGEQITLSYDPAAAHRFDPATGQRR